jgi:choline dehydrogenase-like flavoprotein
MFVDALTDGPVPTSFDVDLCIVGCGPAGLAIAKQFLDSRYTVCVVESGGFECRAQDQLLARGASLGLDAQLAGSRVRAFGGGGSIWGGGCMPVRDRHTHGRSWVPHSDWPVTRDDLLPYEKRASRYFAIDGHDFNDHGSSVEPIRAPHSFEDQDVENYVFARGSLDLGALHRDEIARSRNVTVLLHANVVLLNSDDADRVTEATVRSLSGRESRVRARQFVLASGAIENARLMLVSGLPREANKAAGAAHVGRYFMDHPIVSLGDLAGPAAAEFCWRYDRAASRADGASFPEISLSRNAEQREQIMAGRVHPFLQKDAVDRTWLHLRRVAKRVAIGGQRSTPSQRLKDHLSRSSSSALVSAPADEEFRISDVLNAAWHIPLRMVEYLAGQDVGSRIAARRAALTGYFEQSPHPDNRVTLATRRDALGVPEVQTRWHLMPLDIRSIRVGSELMGRALAKATGTEFRPADWLTQGAAPPVRSAAHHMGTTRMSETAADGVVNRDCAVHGMTNLHIAGSSVFPSGGGWAFPTFTIVALSIRLADRLQLLLAI